MHGKGGHAALPHKVIDPVVIAAQLIINLQQIISRNNNPITPSVLSFGYIRKGATNVIPNEVKIKGTFRTFDEIGGEAHEKMLQMANSVATSMGGSMTLKSKMDIL